MENIFPGFRRHHNDEEEGYDRHGKYAHRPAYGQPGYGAYEYTGQPVGFEHLGSPPKHNEMDAQTIAQLGYEGPEGERRKVEAIEQIYHEHDSRHPNYRHSHHGSHRTEYAEYPPVRPEYADYPPVVSEGYVLDKHGRPKYVGSGYDKHDKHHQTRDSDSDDDGYAGQDDRYRRRYAGDHPHGEDYSEDYREREEYRRRYGVERPPAVKIERKVEGDGTVVERIFPVSSGGSTYARADPGKIHYGRQESFTGPEYEVPPPGPYGRQDSYPAAYAPPYNGATSTYGRRPYEGGSSDYVDERDRRY
ncbi:hypothetical protein Mapa_016261 [Marchantia paleacea]|nr:hypothetical protein Mapa_016261 [Marchantia paleacea]